jgi:hypothetical protein
MGCDNMVEVFTVPISKAQFQQIPENERALIFVCGHILNQISVFMKLVRFSANNDPTDATESKVSGMQTQIILRFLMGILSEACIYFEDREEMIKACLPDMHEEGRAAYDKIKIFLDKKSLLRRVRNNYLYHYPNDKNVERAFKAIPEDEPWEWYLSATNTNSLYFSCELVLGYGLMEATGEPTVERAFGAVMTKAMELANTIPDFSMRIIEVIVTRRLGQGILKPTARTMMSNAPALTEFWLPFYAEAEVVD